MSNSLCLLHNATFALTAFCLVSARVCVLRGRGALMRQDYGKKKRKKKNQSPSPSWKAEAWLSAYRPRLIRLTHRDTGRAGYTRKDRARTHCDRPGQPHVALTDCIRVCTCILLLMMPRLGEGGAGTTILPVLQTGGPGAEQAWVRGTLPAGAKKKKTHLL